MEVHRISTHMNCDYVVSFRTNAQVVCMAELCDLIKYFLLNCVAVVCNIEWTQWSVFWTLNSRLHCIDWLAKMIQHDECSSEQRNIAICFRPIYYFARICGQMPFTITYHANAAIYTAKFHARDFIWSTVSLCIQISLIRLAVDLMTSPQHPKIISSTLYFCNLTVWFITLLFAISMMVLDAHNRSKIVDLLQKFTDFDQEVKEM